MTGFLHLMPEFMAFPDPFTHPGEHGHPAMQRHNGVHELREEHGLSNAGTSE